MSSKKISRRGKTRVSQPGALRGLPTPELKHYSVGLNLTAQDTPPSGTTPALYQVTSMNNLADGSGQSERSGLKIQAKRLRVRVKVAIDPNSTSTFANLIADAHLFRVVVYRDKSPNGVSPGWSTIMDNVPSSSGQEYDFQNIWFKDRFKLLADKFVTVPPPKVVFDGATYHSLGNNKYVEFDVPLDCSIWFSDSTNNVTAIQRNNLGMFIVSDASTTSYTNMKFSFRSQLLYHDY